MKLTRRHFAAAMGGAVLGAHFAPRFVRRAAAQSGGSTPIRFLGIRTPHGADRDYWIPKQPGGGDPASGDQPLSELTFDYANNSLSPMMPWRDRITVLDGVDTQVVKDVTRAGRRTFHGHNEQGVLLTGAAPPEDREGNYDNHPSLDYFLHGEFGSAVLPTAVVEYADGWKAMSYDDGGRPRAPQASPNALWDQIFPPDFVPPMPEDPQDTPAVDYTAGESRIGMYNLAALQRMRARLGGREAEKLDAHIEAMMRLQPTGGGSGGGRGGGEPVLVGTCTPQRPEHDGNVQSWDQVETVARAHARVIAQAFACGRSRAGTLQILNDYPNYFTNLPEVTLAAGQRFHEDLVHGYWAGNGAYLDGYTAGLRWSAGHVAAVLEELDAVLDPYDPQGGSVLDNTIVFWHSEFGHGPHDNQETRHPCVIAGGGGRTLKLGRYLRVRDINGSARVPHNLLLTSILHAVGRTDLNFFGDRDLVDNAAYQGPLTQLMV